MKTARNGQNISKVLCFVGDGGIFRRAGQRAFTGNGAGRDKISLNVPAIDGHPGESERKKRENEAGVGNGHGVIYRPA
ncbi:MAG: hypothetical protein MUE57_04285, partial [Syntrophales bacterium]|nr:hypothetical protein [Syntrophales bacterium]